jgi:membrane associated rhomboid family serine protease
MLVVIILYYFGSLIFSLFPQAERSSFEAHICGFLAGLGAAYLNWLVPYFMHTGT